MNIKKEIIIGIIGSIIIAGMTFFYVNQYNNINKSLTKNSPINQAKTATTSATVSTLTTLTLAEIAKHNKQNDCWIIINNSVYQVTEYLAFHPGGAPIIIPYCGSDATKAYDTKGGKKGPHSAKANQDLVNLKLGVIGDSVNPTNSISQNLNNIKNVSRKETEYEDD